MSALRLMVFAAALAVLAALVAASYDPKRTRLIDTATSADGEWARTAETSGTHFPALAGKVTNFLFRGNLPVLDNHTFAYDEMLSVMATVAASLNVSFPPPPYMLTVLRSGASICDHV
jgi:hypothetical protein